MTTNDKEDLKMGAEKRILTADEINKIVVTFVNDQFLSSSSVKEWTEFVTDAMTTGVTQYEIDNYALTEEEFSKKYC